jgi:hypothetical protein
LVNPDIPNVNRQLPSRQRFARSKATLFLATTTRIHPNECEFSASVLNF